VLIWIANESGTLLPGMNGEVTILVARREGVPAVPVDALRSTRELPTVAASLGLSPDSVRAQLGRQMAALRDARMGSGRGDSLGRGDSRRQRGERAWGDSTWRRGRERRGPSGDRADQGRSWAGGGRGQRGQAVIVQTAGGLEPRLVRIGISDFDYAEVLSGLAEGEQVVLLGALEAQSNRAQQQDRIRERVGSGIPGMSGGGRGAGGGSGRGVGASGGGGR
jgi:hypothetical protein